MLQPTSSERVYPKRMRAKLSLTLWIVPSGRRVIRPLMLAKTQTVPVYNARSVAMSATKSQTNGF